MANHVQKTISAVKSAPDFDPTDKSQALVRELSQVRLTEYQVDIERRHLRGRAQYGYLDNSLWRPDPTNTELYFQLEPEAYNALEDSLTDQNIKNLTPAALLDFLVSNQKLKETD